MKWLFSAADASKYPDLALGVRRYLPSKAFMNDVSVLDKNEKSQMFGITEGAAVRLTTDPGL